MKLVHFDAFSKKSTAANEQKKFKDAMYSQFISEGSPSNYWGNIGFIKYNGINIKGTVKHFLNLF